MNTELLTLNEFELEDINGGLAVTVTVMGVIKAGCWIAGGIFTLGAISGAAEAIAGR